MKEGKLCDEFSPKYYAICALGGLLSAGATHLAITPLDVLKVNMQVDFRIVYGSVIVSSLFGQSVDGIWPENASACLIMGLLKRDEKVNPVKYSSISTSFTTLLREGGVSAFRRGWAGKFYGYGVQGACRFGLYEYLNKIYSNSLKDQNKSLIFFLSSASAEVIANVALCPFEAVKVRVQAQPRFAKGLGDGFPKLYASEGLRGFYKGLIPLWGRNLPFSMIMFSTFEYSVDFLYRNAIQRKKEDCSITQQLGVTCLAGYAAGSTGSIISNPADNIVASLNNNRTSSLKMVVKKIGLRDLFTRSLPIRIMLVGPVVTLQWLLYDTIKVLSGLPTSGHITTEVEATRTKIQPA